MKGVIGYSEVKVVIPYSADNSKRISQEISKRSKQRLQFRVTDELEIKRINWSDVGSEDKIMVASLDVGENEMTYTIDNVPSGLLKEEKELTDMLSVLTKDRLESFGFQKIQDVNFRIHDYSIRREKPPCIIDPILEGEEFLHIIRSTPYELTSKNNSIVAIHESSNKEIEIIPEQEDLGKHDKIEHVIRENDELSFSAEGSEIFNDSILEGMKSLPSEQMRNIDTSSLDFFGALDKKSLSSWFLKHGRKAQQIWESTNGSMFSDDPICSKFEELEYLVDDNSDKYEFLEVWVDLMKILRYEVTILDNKSQREFVQHLNDQSDSEDAIKYIPWTTNCFQRSTSIIDKYDRDDIMYESSSVRGGVCITLDNEDSIDIIYKIKDSRYLGDGKYNGTLMPKLWICEPVSATISDPAVNINRDELYESLKSEPEEKILTNSEIQSCRICTRDLLKPSVGADEFEKDYLKIKQGQELKRRFRDTLEQGYTMDTITLEEMIENQNSAEFSMSGWHTGTICSEIPLMIKKIGSKDYKSYKPFAEGGGAISYKTSEGMILKVDKESLGIFSEEITKERIKKESDYRLDDRIVVSLHSLP